jgi:hypothetical protein
MIVLNMNAVTGMIIMLVRGVTKVKRAMVTWITGMKLPDGQNVVPATLLTMSTAKRTTV